MCWCQAEDQLTEISAVVHEAVVRRVRYGAERYTNPHLGLYCDGNRMRAGKHLSILMCNPATHVVSALYSPWGGKMNIGFLFE